MVKIIVIAIVTHQSQKPLRLSFTFDVICNFYVSPLTICKPKKLIMFNTLCVPRHYAILFHMMPCFASRQTTGPSLLGTWQ